MIPFPEVFHHKEFYDLRILTLIVGALDKLEVSDRLNGKSSCMLPDRHGSRLGLPFLIYINYPKYCWESYISVPYSTRLW